MTQTSDLYFQQIPVGEMANLTYLIGSHSSGEALLVDPAWSVDALLDQAEADGIRVTGALVTHYHQDHVGGSISCLYYSSPHLSPPTGTTVLFL